MKKTFYTICLIVVLLFIGIYIYAVVTKNQTLASIFGVLNTIAFIFVMITSYFMNKKR